MEKDDQFWLNFSYVIFDCLSAYIAWEAINTVGIETGWLERYEQWFVPVNHIGAIVLGAVAALILRSKKDRQEYFLNSISELRKVTWPSLDDTKKMTIVVCVVVAIFAAILAGFDFLWSFLLKSIIA